MKDCIQLAAAYAAACAHEPKCPPYGAPDHDAAVVVADHTIDGGYLLRCNGVAVFPDGGEILPDGVLIAAHHCEPQHRVAVLGGAA